MLNEMRIDDYAGLAALFGLEEYPVPEEPLDECIDYVLSSEFRAEFIEQHHAHVIAYGKASGSGKIDDGGEEKENFLPAPVTSTANGVQVIQPESTEEEEENKNKKPLNMAWIRKVRAMRKGKPQKRKRGAKKWRKAKARKGGNGMGKDTKKASMSFALLAPADSIEREGGDDDGKDKEKEEVQAATVLELASAPIAPLMVGLVGEGDEQKTKEREKEGQKVTKGGDMKEQVDQAEANRAVKALGNGPEKEKKKTGAKKEQKKATKVEKKETKKAEEADEKKNADKAKPERKSPVKTRKRKMPEEESDAASDEKTEEGIPINPKKVVADIRDVESYFFDAETKTVMATVDWIGYPASDIPLVNVLYNARDKKNAMEQLYKDDQKFFSGDVITAIKAAKWPLPKALQPAKNAKKPSPKRRK